MKDRFADLQSRIVAALRDADALGLVDVGIALDMARVHIERLTADLDAVATKMPAQRADVETASPDCPSIQRSQQAP